MTKTDNNATHTGKTKQDLKLKTESKNQIFWENNLKFLPSKN